MKKLLLTLVLLYTAMVCFGQVHIKGKVSGRKETLPSVTVLLLNSDSTMLKGIVTNSQGEFVFEDVAPGAYLLSASMVGYSKFYSQVIRVDRDNITMPDIILEEAVTELGEVIVKAEKQLIEQKIDRLVVNLENSITSAGNTVLEVLQKSPGVVVNKQNKSITLNGKSGVRIMVNEKLMQVPLDVAVLMLEGMNASNVQRIELITSPPSSYDAEGNAGIIHIVTKKQEDFGTRGSIGLTLGQKWAETLGGNFNLNHRNKTLAYFLDYSIIRDHNLHIFETQRQSMNTEFDRSIVDYSHRENVATQQNLSLGFEWRLNKSTVLDVLLTGYKRNWELDAFTNDINKASMDSTVITNMKVYESNIWQNATGSVGLQTTLNSKSELMFNVDYLYYHNDNPSNYDNSLYYEKHNVMDESVIDLKKNTPIQFIIARADYHYNASPSLTLEGGIKGSTSTLTNDVSVQRLINSEWIKDPVFTSYSSLTEQVAALYVSSKWKGTRGWQINSGIRYEYTHTNINTLTEKNFLKRKYGYFFPNFSIKKILETEKDIQLSYSKRITRPTYNDIAPYVFFWGPNTFSAGNTSLYPAISEAITAAYHLKQWIISFQFSHTKKEINSFQPEIDDQSNNLTYRSQNLRYLNTVGLTSSYSLTLASWLEVQSNLTAQYQTAQTSHLRNNVTLHNYGLNVNLVSTVKLPKDFSIEISGMYASKSLSGITHFLPYGSLNAGIQKRLGEKGTLRLAMDDIFNTNNWRIKANSPENNLNSYVNYNWHNRFIRLTYVRNLGNHKLRPVKVRSGSEEERGRIVN
jgi:hypothetical protein